MSLTAPYLPQMCNAGPYIGQNDERELDDYIENLERMFGEVLFHANGR